MANCGTESSKVCEEAGQQPESSNHGYTVLIRLCDKVISGLSREPKALAHTLLGKGLLSQEKVEEIVQIPATNTENAHKIYDMVLGCVQHFPQRYTDFISVLKEKSLLYCDLLTDLRDTYHVLDLSARNQSALSLPQTPPATQLTGSGTNEAQVISTLQARVDILENKFQALASQTLKHLHQANVSIDMFYGQVSCMKHTLKRVAGKYFKECFRRFGVSSSLESLWGELNWFWDFFNYELLEHVVRVMFPEAEDPLLSQLALYKDEIGRFLSSTKLCHFFKVWPFSTDKPQEKEVAELKRVVVRVDRRWEDCTLQDIKSISSTFTQAFFLPRELLLLAGVGRGSISLLWYAPPSLASSIEEEAEKKIGFLSDNGFLSITIGNLQVYPLTPMRQCFLHLQKTYNACSKSKGKKVLAPVKLALVSKEKMVLQ